jgi:hypothetical protein
VDTRVTGPSIGRNNGQRHVERGCDDHGGHGHYPGRNDDDHPRLDVGDPTALDFTDRPTRIDASHGRRDASSRPGANGRQLGDHNVGSLASA